jgi:hypothetical protein
VEKVGSKVVVATGLACVSVALLFCTTLSADSAYGPVLWRMVFLAVGMGLTMAPATESVMGSLPLAKAGVGSAVNDTTRQVGGALGVAIVGSVLSSVYGSKIVELFTGKVPAAAVREAKNGLGEALAISKGAGGAGRGLADGAREAFTSAMHGGALVAAIAAAVGVVVVLAFLPATARATDVELQAHEYEDEMDAAAHHGEDLAVVEV